jgi:RecA/RadA recombinase
MAKKGVTDSFLKGLLKASGNELASILEDDALSNTTDWIDTGSMALNGLMTADINKGIPNNKVVLFQGEKSCGKTYMVLSIAKKAIEKGYYIVYFDSENATEKSMFVSRGIDPNKVMYVPIDTVENFRNQLIKVINDYNNNTDPKRPKLLIILDSLGNLSTNKEIADAEEGKNVSDMTRAKIIRSIYRSINLKLAKAKIPMLVTNHTYSIIGSYVPTTKGSGGQGPEYIASVMIDLKKKNAKDKDGNLLGFYITAKNVKNRTAREQAKVITYLDFFNGLHKYYGLQEFGGTYLKKETRGWSVGGKSISEKEVWKMEWDETLLNKINENIKNTLSLGNTGEEREMGEEEISEEESVKEEA